MALQTRTVRIRRIETGPAGPATVTCYFTRIDPPPASEVVLLVEVPAGPALDVVRDARRAGEQVIMVTDDSSAPETLVRVCSDA